MGSASRSQTLAERQSSPEGGRRIEQIGARGELQPLIERLVGVAQAGLPRMFRRDQRTFVHHVERVPGGSPRLAGESIRYGGMVALGARWLDEPDQRLIFGGATAAEFMAEQIASADGISNLGDLAVVSWAAATLDSGNTAPVLRRLAAEVARADSLFTVELAWTLSALVAGRREADFSAETQAVRDRLLSVFQPRTGLFPHVVGPGASKLRGHVSCFADQVYPIQALSKLHAALGDREALAAATRCGEQICDVQGPDGQWWWHYDARNGSVIEGYPVYSVHQDAMGPMCLFDLQEAGGPDFSEPIRLGLLWMDEAAEVGHSLIDDEHSVIWRKVGRAEPGKLMRGIRAVASLVHPGLRLRALDGLAPTTRIDYESRPYHLGWVLDTWLAR